MTSLHFTKGSNSLRFGTMQSERTVMEKRKDTIHHITAIGDGDNEEI